MKSLLYFVLLVVLLIGCNKEDVDSNKNQNEHFPASSFQEIEEKLVSLSPLYLTADDGFVLAGGNQDRDFHLLEFDDQCNKLWGQSYGGSQTEEVIDMIPTSDGGFIIAGITSSFGQGHNDAYFVKTNPEGQESWTTTVGNKKSDIASSIVELDDGSFVWTGLTQDTVNANVVGGNADVIISRLSSDGELIWISQIDSSYTDWGRAIVKGDNEDLFVVGTIRAGTSAADKMILANVKQDGEIKWVISYDDILVYIYQLEMIRTNDGGLLVVGGRTEAAFDNNVMAFMMKLNVKGEIEWLRDFGGGTDSFNSVIQTEDNGFIMTGNSYRIGDGNGDVLIIKTDVMGNLLWSKTYGGPDYEPGIDIKEMENGDLILCGLRSEHLQNNFRATILKMDAEGVPK